MKTNQIFSFKRFRKYAISNATLSYRQTLMMWGALVVSIFTISFYTMETNSYNWYKGWLSMFTIIFFVAGILFASFSFASFRSKEKTIMSLMLPVTAFERFLSEFLGKIIAFIILYPVVFSLSGNFAVFIRNMIGTKTIETYDITELINGTETVIKVATFPFKYMQIQDIFKTMPTNQISLGISLAIFMFSLSFAGSATLRKYPLIKTLVFVGSIILAIIGYFYLVFEKMNRNNPWIENTSDKLNNEQQLLITSSILIVFSLITLTYAFFKVKEKEVS